MGTFSVCNFIRILLWQRKINVIDADFTEFCEDVIISVFGVYFPVANKVFK